MAQQVHGKTAIITGAGSGINLEFARLLLERNCNVLFADIALRPEAESLIKQYESTPNKAVFQKTDVTSWPDLNNMFSAATTHFGSVDIVCPGAGVFEPHWTNFWYPPGTSESADDPLGGRYKLLDINLTHPIRVTQLAISHFLKSASPANPKSIVHLSSVAAEIATMMFPMYCVSKHGIQAFVRCMGDLEASHGIRVTAVGPGLVRTPIWTEHPEKLQIINQEGSNADQFATPEFVARVMLACVENETISSEVEGEGPIPIRGGSCLEVLANSVRDVPLFNNVGPYASGRPGAESTNSTSLTGEIMGFLKPGWGET